MNIHVNAAATEQEVPEGELSLSFLKKFINYARSRCGPRLSQVILDVLLALRSANHKIFDDVTVGRRPEEGKI